jgi:hypothetical protein
MADGANTPERAAIETARSVKDDTQKKQDEVVLSTGYTVRLHPVSLLTIQDSQQQIKDPPVPQIERDDGKKMDNPDDPAYQQAKIEAQEKRNMAAVEVAVMLGLEVLAGPSDVNDDGWLKNLNWLEKRGLLDLSNFDLNDDLDREYIFKRYIVLGRDSDFALIGAIISGQSEEEVQTAINKFRGN